MINGTLTVDYSLVQKPKNDSNGVMKVGKDTGAS